MSLSSRSAGIRRKLIHGISSTILFQTRRWGVYTCFKLKQKTVDSYAYYDSKILAL